MSTPNNRGREVVTVTGYGDGHLLEVWETDERGKRTEILVGCHVAEGETDETAVGHLLAEFLHPFGAAWEDAETYGRELDAVKWLAAFYGINPEGQEGGRA